MNATTNLQRNRKYNPLRILKNTGVYTVYLGQPTDPLVEVFEAYCILNRYTGSTSIREITHEYFRRFGLLDKTGKTTEKFKLLKKQADQLKVKQIQELEQLKEEKKDKKKGKEVVEDDENEENDLFGEFDSSSEPL